ncbi:hypothetical protein DPMN_017014 [Dreissena polymorpha]|uniref:Uncharacterized protein n=1 Tax=Dreissena polymorpha TaxID=45954 RepID=A0A9D4NDX8_DREPO|nr:hypothetical protein DPMN_017014 [Dreissena polymorpha]
MDNTKDHNQDFVHDSSFYWYPASGVVSRVQYLVDQMTHSGPLLRHDFEYAEAFEFGKLVDR